VSKSAIFKVRWVYLTANFRWTGMSPPTIYGVRKPEFFATHNEDCIILKTEMGDTDTKAVSTQ